jgi:allantoicase
MFTRFIDTAKLHAALAALASLTSCMQHTDASSDDGSAQDEPLGEMISCAVDNSSVFTDNCRMERDSGGLLVIHHPDGSFHRLRLQADGQSPGGQSVATADGFLQASSHPGQNGALEVQVGDDRYVIPSAAGSSASGS